MHYQELMKLRNYILTYYHFQRVINTNEDVDIDLFNDESQRSITVTFSHDMMILQHVHQGVIHLIHINFKNMTVEKPSSLFTLDELRFFENLGFDISRRHQNETDQSIDDWFWK